MDRNLVLSASFLPSTCYFLAILGASLFCGDNHGIEKKIKCLRMHFHTMFFFTLGFGATYVTMTQLLLFSHHPRRMSFLACDVQFFVGMLLFLVAVYVTGKNLMLLLLVLPSEEGSEEEEEDSLLENEI